MKTVELREVVDGLKMNFTCVMTDEEYQKYEELMEKNPETTQNEALDIAQPKLLKSKENSDQQRTA